jgi:hypothetical protein
LDRFRPRRLERRRVVLISLTPAKIVTVEPGSTNGISCSMKFASIVRRSAGRVGSRG